MDVTRILLENIINTNYENLPLEIVEKTKSHILDILGVMFPASTLEKGCQVLEEIAKEGNGRPESTLIGFGGKVPCWMAAFVNGSLCHALDYDDIWDGGPTHPSGHTFPAALAIAEKLGSVSGKEFITAMALGIDLNVRLSSAPRGSAIEDYPWFLISVFGVFSATVAAGKLLGLDIEKMINAFGIALDRASGITESIFSPDSEIRAIRDGFGNREGVFAALMAQKEITAFKGAIETVYKVFYRGNYDSSSLVSNLGREFKGQEVSLKAWPCCRGTHMYVQVALGIATSYDVVPEKIREIILTVGRWGRDYFFNPLEAKQKPKLSINAKTSLPFIMGIVFTKKRVLIEDFLAENLQDPNVLEIAEKVKYKFDELSQSNDFLKPSHAHLVEVKMQDGSSFSNTGDILYGHPKNPISHVDIVAKFRDCARYAKKTLPEEKITHLAEKILRLETVKNMEEITQVLK
jgi:2-methylcitrate dehydratase PrpD